MIPPVLVEFAAGGVASVEKAFDTVEARIIRLEQSSTRASEAGTRTRMRAAESEAAARGKAAEIGAQAGVRAEQSAARELERLEQYKQRVMLRSAEMAGRFAKQQEREEVQAKQRAAREVERLEEYKRRVMLRSAEMASAAAEKAATAEIAARERVNRGIGSAAGRGLRNSLGGIGSLVGGAMAIGGGFALADIAKKELSAERQAALIVNEVTKDGKAAPGANVAAILGRSSQVSRETGMAKGDVLSGTLAYTRAAKSGDFSTAMANMGFFAKIAKTTGSNIEDVATGAGMLQSQNPKLRAPEMRQMLLDIMAQGHAGSIPLNEMVGLAGIVGSARGSFAGDSATNQRKLLGLTQLARSEAGGQEEAARGIKQMAIEADKPKKAALLRSWGVKYDAHGQMESPEQLILAALKGTDGNLLQLGQVFGTRSGGLMKHMAETYRGAGGGAAGLAAAQKEMAEVTSATTTPKDLEAQFQQLMSTPAEKFQKALNDISEVIAMRLEPIMTSLADKMTAGGPAIEQFMTSILNLAEWLIANPWQGLGAAVALSITKEIAGAALGQMVGASLQSAIGARMAGGLAVAAASIAITMATVDFLAHREVQRQQGEVAGVINATNTANNLLAGTRAGTVTPAQVAKAQQEAAALGAKGGSSGPSATGVITSALGLDMLHGEAPGTAMQLSRQQNVAEMKNTADVLKRLRMAIELATPAIAHLGGAAANNPARNLPISQRPVQ